MWICQNRRSRRTDPQTKKVLEELSLLLRINFICFYIIVLRKCTKLNNIDLQINANNNDNKQNKNHNIYKFD